MADSGNAKKGKKGAELYLELLATEGYRPWINDDGDVAFKCEGRNLVIKIDEEDQEFFYLVYPDFWPIESDEELSRVMEIALAVTAENKVIKIFPVGDTNTWATRAVLPPTSGILFRLQSLSQSLAYECRKVRCQDEGVA